MKCEIIRDLIPLYCDGLCSDETRAAVEEHIAGCEDCKRLLETSGADIEVPAPQVYDEEEARVLRGIKKRYARIRWRAVFLAVGIAAALIAVVGGVYYSHVHHALFPDYPDVHLTRTTVRHDSLFEGKEAYDEHIMVVWSGNDKKVRELVFWNQGVDLEIHYLYTAPFHIEASGEVKGGKTTLRYEGYVTTRDGETIEYKNEMTFDGAFGPEGELFVD